MNLMELKSSMANKDIHNLYIFYGAEYAILEIYIKKLKDIVGGQYVQYDDVASLYRTLDKKDMFGSQKKFVLIREDKDFLTSESMWKDFESKLSKKDITLVLKYSSIDQRSKFSKAFSDRMTEFTYLSKEVLTKYIKKEIDITDSCCQYLCDITHNDYGRILLEVDKVKSYAQIKNISDMDAFKQCYSENVFHCDVEGEVYDLVNAIMIRSIKDIHYLLQESKERKDNPIMVLAILHNNVRTLLQLQLAGDVKDLADRTGLTGFQIKNGKQFVGVYDNKELVRFMKYIRYCEKGIKNGLLNSDNAIDYLLINVL
jgi:DNA polymerase-3 subunit delta